VDEAELFPWNDPVDLIGALAQMQKEELALHRDALYRLAQHEDADVRSHAFRRLFVHLRDEEHRGVAQDAILHDPAPGVRRVAAFAIASTSSAASREDDSRLLLHSFLDSDEVIAVRGAAYEGLLLVYGRMDFPPVKRDLQLETDVDWDWIGQLRAMVGV
jgi:hypothetical protein